MNMSYSVKRKRAMLAIFSAAGRPVDFAGLLEVNECERHDCTLRGRPAGTIGKNNTRKGVRYAKSAYL